MIVRTLLPLTLVFGLFGFAGLRDLEPARRAEPAPAKEGWKIDPGHSSVVFRIRHLDAAEFWGRFNVVAGRFLLDPENPEASAVEVEIPVDSIDTNSAGRDRHLKSPDFFSAQEFPKLTFRSKKAEKVAEGRMRLVGDLVLRGKTREVTVEARFTGRSKINDRFGEREGWSCEFVIDRSDFGMNYGLEGKVLGDAVTITVALEGMKAD